MKKSKLAAGILALTLALTACSSGSGDSATDFRSKDDTYLDINGEKVSYAKFYQFYDLYSGIMSMGQGLSSELTNLFILDNIITRDLQANDIEVTDEEVQSELDTYVKNLGSQEAYNNYISMLGINEEIFEENIKNSIKNTKHKEWYASQQEYTDEQISTYYEENKDAIDNVVASHILVNDEATANKVIAELESGKDFTEVSNEYSTDTAANANGGNLGKITKSQFDADFVNAAFQLQADEISQPVKSKFGYHVIKVSENNVGPENNTEAIKTALSSADYNAYIQEEIQGADLKMYTPQGDLVGGETSEEAQTNSETTGETDTSSENETSAE